jgi:beta-lactamase regulating signal transducer with metallopeptidase domain
MAANEAVVEPNVESSENMINNNVGRWRKSLICLLSHNIVICIFIALLVNCDLRGFPKRLIRLRIRRNKGEAGETDPND